MGVGKIFFANLQLLLERHLYLSLVRLYGPYSSRNPGRSIPAVIQLIRSRARELRIVNRQVVIDFLSEISEFHGDPALLYDEELSLRLAGYFGDSAPKADSSSDRPLDRALANLKAVRDKAIAHHDRVDPVSLVVPGWPAMVALIDIAGQFAALVAKGYLGVQYDLASDASRPVTSLRRLLERAGLAPSTVSGDKFAT